MSAKPKQNDWEKASDEELFDALREQVNLARNSNNHDRVKTRAVAAAATKRGWNLGKPPTPTPSYPTKLPKP